MIYAAYYMFFCYAVAIFMCIVWRDAMAPDEAACVFLLAPVMITIYLFVCLGGTYNYAKKLIHNGNRRWQLRQDDLRDPGGE